MVLIIAAKFGKKNRMHYALKTGIYAILINKNSIFAPKNEIYG